MIDEIKDTICSPNVALQFNNTFTCFTLKELVFIARLYNNWVKESLDLCNTNTCIKKNQIIDLNKVYKKCKNLDYCEKNDIKKQLWDNIKEKLYPLCKNDEQCWINLNFLKKLHKSDDLDKRDKRFLEKIRLFTFKPKKIRTERNWLNTLDINNVLKQYEQIDSKFKFIGALPSNFYKIQHVDLDKLNKYKRIGIVLNLDSYDMSGSHWVAVYIDKNKKQIEYFDSTGKPPNDNIQIYIEKYLIKCFPNYNYLQNKFEHQLLDTECGVYSLYYIINRLFGFSFEYITSNVIRDDEMQKFRKYIFL